MSRGKCSIPNPFLQEQKQCRSSQPYMFCPVSSPPKVIGDAAGAVGVVLGRILSCATPLRHLRERLPPQGLRASSSSKDFEMPLPLLGAGISPIPATPSALDSQLHQAFATVQQSHLVQPHTVCILC